MKKVREIKYVVHCGHFTIHTQCIELLKRSFSLTICFYIMMRKLSLISFSPFYDDCMTDVCEVALCMDVSSPYRWWCTGKWKRHKTHTTHHQICCHYVCTTMLHGLISVSRNTAFGVHGIVPLSDFYTVLPGTPLSLPSSLSLPHRQSK